MCELERPWRTQANIIQATCHLESLEKRLAVLSVPGGQPVGPTFDSAGVIIEGVVPVYNKALAGANVSMSVCVDRMVLNYNAYKVGT